MNKKAKRNLFSELQKGLEEIGAHQKGKITLRTHTFKKRPLPRVDAVLIRNLREQYHMSRGVFALKLRVSVRTLEKWEQGETVPNDQAAALILMLKKFPDTFQRLDEIEL